MPISAANANANAIETVRSSYELLNDPLLNKGTAFTEAGSVALSGGP